MTQNNIKKRIEFIDLAKGFCILFVLFTHAKGGFDVSSAFDLAMASFRMPLYFILSGLFFKEYNGLLDFAKRKTNKLLIPFVFFYIIIALCFPFVIEAMYSGFIKNEGINYLFCFYNENFNGMPMGIWFLWCLFIVNILFYTLIIISKNLKYQIATLIILSIILGWAGIYLGQERINLPLYLDTALTAIPFFCFGYIIRKFTNVLYPNRYDKYTIPFAIICFVLVYTFAYDRLSFRMNEFDVNAFSVYACGILGAMGTLFLSKRIKHLPFVSTMGRYSIMVLCSHQIIMLALHLAIKQYDINNWYGVWIVFVITSVISYLLISPMKKFLPYVTAQKDIL